MIVFEWFYEQNETFEELLKVEEGYEVCMSFVVIYVNCISEYGCIYIILENSNKTFTKLKNHLCCSNI